MDKRIIYTRPDGGVSIIVPDKAMFDPASPVREPIKEKLVTEQDVFDWFLRSVVPEDAIDVRIIDLKDHPHLLDRSFRNAWEQSGGAIEVNMVKARNLHRDKLRVMRAPLLSELDIQYMLADELGDAKAKADIARRKKALRDVTADPAIEAAQTPDELKAVIPAALIP
jgi:hypothetical protein